MPSRRRLTAWTVLAAHVGPVVLQTGRGMAVGIAAVDDGDPGEEPGFAVFLPLVLRQ